MRIFNLLILVILTLFFWVRCAAIFGITEPEEITKQQAKNYLLKHNMDTSGVIFMKKNKLDSLIKIPFKPDWQPGFRPLQVKLFSNSGELLFHYSSCEGSIKKTNISNTYPPNNITPIDSTYTLFDEQLIVEEELQNQTNANNIAIIYWSSFTGVFGRKFVKKTEKKLRKADPNIIILKLNTDYIK